jgi:transcriptional regulator with XRE-family HTH domain
METTHFDVEAFFAALDAHRQAKKLTWKQVAPETGVSASTLTRIAQGKKPRRGRTCGTGALLIPDEAAFQIAKSAQSNAQAAEEYGVSEKMIVFRLRVTGALIRAQRAQRYFRGRA